MNDESLPKWNFISIAETENLSLLVPTIGSWELALLASFIDRCKSLENVFKIEFMVFRVADISRTNTHTYKLQSPESGQTAIFMSDRSRQNDEN